MIRFVERLRAAWLAFRDPGVVEVKDVLTGALTRKAFSRAANRELARAKRQQRQFSLVYVDVDNLKSVNDTQGHKAGDAYLVGCVQSIIKHIRPYDVLARVGGDEFVILFPNTSENEAESITRRIYQTFPSFSWGISSWSEWGSSSEGIEGLLSKADVKMYEMKVKRKARSS